MPSYTFTDAENISREVIPPGKYMFEVVGADETISQGQKTRGSDVLELKIKFFDKDNKPRAQWTEKLLFHETTHWKIDTFVKCTGAFKNPKVGQQLTLTPENVLGLRGWCMVKIEEYDSKRTGAREQSNKVDAFLTDAGQIAKAEPKVQKIHDEDIPSEDDL